MNANRVILNGVPILDLTEDTAQKIDVGATKSFHLRTGEKTLGLREKPTTEDRVVVPTKNRQIVTPTTADFLMQVIVEPIPSDYISEGVPQISSATEMTSLLTTAEVGSVVKYMGETTDTYESGALYIEAVSE